MAVPSRVQRRNANALTILMDDGTRHVAYKVGGFNWLVRGGGSGPGPGPDPDPDPITITNTCDGDSVVIEGNRMNYSVVIYQAAQALGLSDTLTRKAGVCALMTAMVESVMLMYANSNVPESLDYPHDAVGSDEDSLGLMQQRPSSGWGTVAELMDASYNARAFYGGPNGPNAGNPPGLLDQSDFETNEDWGALCQAVQVSAFPERYNCWRDGAEQLYDHIATSGTGGDFAWHYDPRPQDEGGDMPPNGSSDQPLAEFGPRELTGSFHEGIDFGYGSATAGATNRSTGAGTVSFAGDSGGWGLMVLIFHGTLDYNGEQKDIYTRHAHHSSLLVTAGDTVSVGTGVGILGDTGNVTGPHDHYETHVCAVGETPVNNINDPAGYRTAIDPRDFHSVMGNSVQP